MLELDHIIVFLPHEPDPPRELTLGGGTRHTGQGTRNRRIVFAAHYIELLWIDDPEAEQASGLGFGPRCAGTAFRYGIVLRGTRPDGRFRSYTVPDGPTLAVHDGTPAMPFIAVFERSPERLADLRAEHHHPVPTHPNGDTGIEHITLKWSRARALRTARCRIPGRPARRPSRPSQERLRSNP